MTWAFSMIGTLRDFDLTFGRDRDIETSTLATITIGLRDPERIDGFEPWASTRVRVTVEWLEDDE